MTVTYQWGRGVERSHEIIPLSYAPKTFLQDHISVLQGILVSASSLPPHSTEQSGHEKKNTLFSKCRELLSKLLLCSECDSFPGPDKLDSERESAPSKIKLPRCWTINCSVSPCLSSPLRRRRWWDWPPQLTEFINFSSCPSPGIRKFPTSKYQCWVLPIPDDQWEIV